MYKIDAKKVFVRHDSSRAVPRIQTGGTVIRLEQPVTSKREWDILVYMILGGIIKIPFYVIPNHSILIWNLFGLEHVPYSDIQSLWYCFHISAAPFPVTYHIPTKLTPWQKPHVLTYWRMKIYHYSCIQFRLSRCYMLASLSALFPPWTFAQQYE